MNTKWEIRKDDGSSTTCFQDITKHRVDYFEGIYKKDSRASTGKLVRMTSFFLILEKKRDNARLLKEVSKDELLQVKHSFEKDKFFGSNGWRTKFF